MISGIKQIDGFSSKCRCGTDSAYGNIILKLLDQNWFQIPSCAKAHNVCKRQDLLLLRCGGGLRGCITSGGDSEPPVDDVLSAAPRSMLQRSCSSMEIAPLTFLTECQSCMMFSRASDIWCWICKVVWQLSKIA
jgi:hypothetical protein